MFGHFGFVIGRIRIIDALHQCTFYQHATVEQSTVVELFAIGMLGVFAI